jgi:hypothetical protein
VEDGEDNLEDGIEIDPCVGVEIGTTELSGWSGEAIGISDNAERQQTPRSRRAWTAS